MFTSRSHGPDSYFDKLLVHTESQQTNNENRSVTVQYLEAGVWCVW